MCQGAASYQQPSVLTNATQETALQLEALHRSQLLYTKRIENERTRLHQIDKKVCRMQSSIDEFKKSVGGEFSRRQRQIGAVRQTARLESQLQTVKEKRGKLRHKIDCLAAEINNKRREKMQHERVCQKSEQKLIKRRHALSRLHRELQEREDERERVGKMCESLKSEILDEMEEFNEKVSTTHNSIVAASASRVGGGGLTHMSSMQTIHTQPSVRRPGDFSGPSSSSKTAAGVRPTASFITDPHSEDIDMQQEVNKAYWVVAKTRMDLTKQIERKEELFNAFDKICSETGVHVDHTADVASGKHPLEQLVPLLLKSEEENYVIFRKINELNEELESLQLENVQLDQDLKASKTFHTEKANSEEKIKADLGEKLEQSTSIANTHDQAHKLNELDLMRASDAISALFTKLGCDNRPSGEALVSTGLTERNVQQFLGLIEDQIVELLQIEAHVNSSHKSTEDPTRPNTPKYTREGKRVPSLVLPDVQHHSVMDASLSGHDDATDVDDDGQTAPIDPSRWMQTLRAGDAGSLTGMTLGGKFVRNRKLQQ